MNDPETAKCLTSKTCPDDGQSIYLGQKCVNACPGGGKPTSGHCPIPNCKDPLVQLINICCKKGQFNNDDKCVDECPKNDNKVYDSFTGKCEDGKLRKLQKKSRLWFSFPKYPFRITSEIR